MKILHVIDSGGLYGAEKMILTLVAEQVKQGYEPMILSVGDLSVKEKALEAEARSLGLPIKPWRMKEGLNLGGTRQIAEWAQNSGYKVLHSHGYKFNILFGLVVRSSSSVRIVSTLHGYTTVHPFSKLWLYQMLDQWMLRYADAVVVVSERICPRFLTRSSVELIPNGITQEIPLCEVNSPYQPKSRYLIAVGRLSREKAYDLLIKAFCELEGPKVELVLVGDGPEKGRLEELVAQKGFGDRIHFTGYLQNTTALIKNAEAIVISSLTEGMPLVVLEAMRALTPVVSTPVGEIPKVLEYGKLGYLASGNTVNDIRDAISNLLANELVARHKANAAKEVFNKNYTAVQMAARYAKVYGRMDLH